ncbi:hypothetical protein EG328_010690 [Venturia inaequalis]|uniref:Uncharacterized protein n=1 Tax=Venturia inaequalis TaxID=5025 RepID=A0A8H3V407_VENIN|nr:hypothetical protein EG328_010690 [Venturia inaequalis]RDI84274.1 hypothetical protein Vi05172_g5647 [Venturia inaequalis]
MSTPQKTKTEDSSSQPHNTLLDPTPTLFNVFTMHQTKGEFNTPAALLQSGRAKEFEPTEMQARQEQGTEKPVAD